VPTGGHSMEFEGKKVELAGDHFLANIALDEKIDGRIVAVQRDPRKARIKPAAYVGVIEEVGAGCRLVKPGDRVVIERWTYEQVDVDDERLVARERDLLILNDSAPAPHVLVLQIIDDKGPMTTLALPDSCQVRVLPSYCGMVVASSDRFAEPGEILWVEKSDMGQFSYGNGLMAFRNNGRAQILARGWTKEFQENKRQSLDLSEAAFAVFCDEIKMQDIQGGTTDVN
jgi:hypothetical protein